MKPIPGLTEEDIQSLVDYVIYLSWRGELERTALDDAMFELDLEAGDRILNYEFAERLAAAPDLRSKLAAINEDIDGDELADYENYLAMDARLNSESALKSILDQAVQSEDEPEDSQLAKDLEAYENYQDFALELSDDAELKAKLDQALKQTTAEELLNYERYVESWEVAEDFVGDIGDSWLEAEDEILEVPDPPTGFPLAESRANFVQLSQGEKATELAASVKRGQELFVGKIATCSKCHGEKGLGNGQTADYDDWTKDWTTRVGLKPEDKESLIPLLARGALPPRNAIPRNFAEGVFRGGSSSQDLYRRIMQGIDGTPMPAATFVEGQFEQDDVWHLINFIRSLQMTDAEEAVAPAPAA
jgi:mono/diheme cytochrome c family protein